MKYRTEIQGLIITVSKKNINIKGSYKINNPIVMESILSVLKDELEENHIESPFGKRSISSMVREWISHNNAYKIGYKESQTCNLDLNYPQKWYAPIIYWFLSLIEL